MTIRLAPHDAGSRDPSPLHASDRRRTRGPGGGRVGLAVAAVAALALSACSAPGEGTEGGEDALRLSLTHQVVFDVAVPDAVAQDQGLYEEAGVEVQEERIYPDGSGDAVQALVSDSADIAVGVAFPAALSAIQQGAPVRIVAAEYQGYGDVTYYVPEDSPMRSLDDTAGASVSSSGPGSTTDLLGQELRKQIKSSGGEAPSIEALGSPPDIFTAVRTGQVDVGWTTPPFFFENFADGSMRQIGTGNDIELLAGTTARVTLARQDVVEDRPEDLTKFFDAYQSAIDFVYDNPDETLEIWKEAAELDTSTELLEQAMESYPEESLDLDEIVGLDVLLEEVYALGYLDEPLSEDDVMAAVSIDEIIGG
ncbi:MAG: PhnD/SsuA/transferrin family substrate-binding protein [Actinophytocola sp.]|nr:PhnD/SsuA/transferrin family substrate-binding protein [Actinophytocola sp.]